MAEGVFSQPIPLAEASRRAGRLQRSLGFSQVFSFATLAVGLVPGALLLFSTVAGRWPGSQLILLLSIGAVAALAHAGAYAAIGAAFPFSGSDYVLVTRTLSAPLGFAFSFAFVILTGLTIGGLAAFVPKTLLPVVLQSIGAGSNNAGALSLASTLLSPTGSIMVGTLLVVAAFLAAIGSPRLTIRLAQGALLILLVGWIIQYAQLGFSPANGFPSAFDRVTGLDMFNGRYDLAASLGIAFDPQPWFPLAGLFLGYWIFFGAFGPSLAAGEVRKPGRNLIGGTLLAVIFGWALLAGVIFLVQRLIPSDWLAIESALWLAKSQVDAMPWLLYYAAIAQPNPFLIAVTGAAFALSLVATIQLSMTYLSRVIYAWAKDGVLPSLAAYIPAKQHNPVLAVLVAAVLVQIGLLDAVLGGLMESPLALLPVIALSQTVPMLAAVVLPFTRRKWSSASPHIVWAGIGPLPVLSLVALVSLLFLLWMAFGPLVAPLLGVSFQLATLFWFVILLAVGVGFFLARKTHLPRSTFREFPQDELLDL